MRISPTLLLIAAGFLIPNAIFFGALAVGLAGEPRVVALCFYALLFALPLPLWARLTLFPLVLILDALAVVSGLFGFGLTTLIGNIPYMIDIKAYSDPTFLTLILLLVATLAIGMLFIFRFNDRFAGGNRTVLLALAALFVVHDMFAYDARANSGSAIVATLPDYDSGVDRSGFKAVLSDPQRPHVLFVLVESLGKFFDAAKQDLVFEPLLGPDIRARYTVTAGTSPFWKSTTAAEMRELCASQEPFRKMGPEYDPECLPDMFRARGYDTVAFHGFLENFFERRRWYPFAGFEKTVFLNDLYEDLPQRCGNVWQGICDKDLGPQIEHVFSSFERPTFLYWLTLNTHVPVNPRDGTGELGCNTPQARIADGEVCVMAELWRDVMKTVGRIANSDKKIEVFIVGDHRPPLIRRAARYQFSDTEVPWLRLSPRQEMVRGGPHKAAIDG